MGRHCERHPEKTIRKLPGHYGNAPGGGFTHGHPSDFDSLTFLCGGKITSEKEA